MISVAEWRSVLGCQNTLAVGLYTEYVFVRPCPSLRQSPPNLLWAGLCGTVSQLCTVVAFPPGGAWLVLTLTAQQLCEGRGGRPGLPVPNKPHGFCGRKAPLNQSSLGDPVRLVVQEVTKFFRPLFRPILFLVSLTSHLDCSESSGFS